MRLCGAPDYEGMRDPSDLFCTEPYGHDLLEHQGKLYDHHFAWSEENGESYWNLYGSMADPSSWPIVMSPSESDRLEWERQYAERSGKTTEFMRKLWMMLR